MVSLCFTKGGSSCSHVRDGLPVRCRRYPVGRRPKAKNAPHVNYPKVHWRRKFRPNHLDEDYQWQTRQKTVHQTRRGTCPREQPLVQS
jgi:hypothetical protein